MAASQQELMQPHAYLLATPIARFVGTLWVAYIHEYPWCSCLLHITDVCAMKGHQHLRNRAVVQIAEMCASQYVRMYKFDPQKK